jgi:ABC-type dipeptide/oligopeptide/nickel transport system permease subunit
MSSESLNSPGVPTLKAEATGAALTPGQLIWRRFRKHRIALVGGVGIVALLLFVIVGSILIPLEKANYVDLSARLSSPSAIHWLGTDSTGRDGFSRIVYGGQISLIIGFLAVVISVSVGTVMGAGWTPSSCASRNPCFPFPHYSY